ncbi:DUF1707 SHOCT-like domain-containing protein [Pseudonocardia saturnea]
MTTSEHPSVPAAVRVSDAEREEVAQRLRAAATDGRLTLAEADERQALAYAAQFHHDLAPLTADLPWPAAQAPAPARGWGDLGDAARRRLAVHVGAAAVFATLLLIRWVVGFDGPDVDGPRFWPVWPLFWISLSVLFHYRHALRRGR